MDVIFVGVAVAIPFVSIILSATFFLWMMDGKRRKLYYDKKRKKFEDKVENNKAFEKERASHLKNIEAFNKAEASYIEERNKLKEEIVSLKSQVAKPSETKIELIKG